MANTSTIMLAVFGTMLTTVLLLNYSRTKLQIWSGWRKRWTKCWGNPSLHGRRAFWRSELRLWRLLLNILYQSTTAFRVHLYTTVTLSNQTGMIAGIGVILVCLVPSVKPFSLLNQGSPSVTTFTVENSNLFASNGNLRTLLKSNVYKHRKNKKNSKRNSREKHPTPTPRKRRRNKTEKKENKQKREK